MKLRHKYPLININRKCKIHNVFYTRQTKSCLYTPDKVSKYINKYIRELKYKPSTNIFEIMNSPYRYICFKCEEAYSET